MNLLEYVTMCLNCYEQYGSPKVVNDKVKQAVEMIDAVYEYNAVGSNLHIVLDDFNLEDEWIESCLEKLDKPSLVHEVTPDQRSGEIALGQLLLRMTLQERASALAIKWGYVKPQLARVRRLSVANELLVNLVSAGEYHAKLANNPVPVDAKIVAVYPSGDGRDTVFIIESQAYEEVETFLSDDVPHVETPVWQTIDCRQTQEIIAAVAKHRDQRGDDRCWRDDDELYATVFGAGQVDTSLPPEAEFLVSCARSCKQYWNNRQRPDDKRLEPTEMTIQQLQAEVERLLVFEHIFNELCP